MSFKLGGIVIEDLNRGLSAHEKLILVCYASFGNPDGTSIHPSQAAIAQMAMCKPRMVRKALAKFEADRVMIFVQKVGRRKEYRLDIERAIELYGNRKKAAPYAGMDEGKAAHGAGVNVAHGDGIAACDDQNSGTVCQESYQDPVKNPSAPGAAGGQKATPPPADPGAHWRQCEDALKTRFGEADYASWISILVPINDFGGTLKLAAPSDFIKDVICKKYQTGIAEVTERKIKIEKKYLPETPKDAAA